jgi:tRNA threonylcarbamoyladenosine biosynthesis protein TsaE
MKIATAQEMFGLGEKIGAQLRAGDLILLNGPLGAGKTLSLIHI